MKKIIDGKVYNTDTAKLLGGYYYSTCNDFSYFEEELYITKKGAYFLYGEGGPMSKYSESCGNNSWSGSCKIRLMSLEDAMKWGEKYMDGDEYINAFGEYVEEG